MNILFLDDHANYRQALTYYYFLAKNLFMKTLALYLIVPFILSGHFVASADEKHSAVKPEPRSGGWVCLLYTSPSPRDKRQSRMPSSA